MRKRTQAREIALQVIYQQDLRREPPKGEAIPVEFEAFIAEASQDPLVRQYARFLVEGTLSALPGLDSRISEVLEHWKMDRVAPVDRSILRIALFELLESPDLPPKVAINEAIELAKKYSTEQSGAFVNGILDKLYGQIHGSAKDT